jgi:HNH endonuclease
MSPGSWIRRQFQRARIHRRSRCRSCGRREELQFAHRRPTGLEGRGRGREKRLYDIKHHPRAYVLLCKWCHRDFDRGQILPASPGLGWRCTL